MNIPSPTPHDFLKEFLDSKPKLQAANAEKNLKKQVRFQLPDGSRRVMTNADFMLYAVNNGLNVAASPEKGSVRPALVDKIRNSFSRMDNYKAIVTSLGDLYRLTPEMKHLENLMQKGLTQQNTKEWYNARENAVNSLIDANATTITYYHVQLNNNGSVIPITKTMYDFAQMVHEKRLVELKQQTTALLSDKSFRDFSIDVNNNGGILVGENTGNSIVNLDDNNHLILQELSVDNPENIINTTPFDDLPKDRQATLLNEAMENAADLLRELNINRLMDQLKTNALPVPEELADITLTNGHQVKLKEVFRHEGDGPQLNYNSIQVTFIPNGYVPYQIERKILDTILTQAQQNQLGTALQASQSVVSTPTSKSSLSEASDQQTEVSQTHERHNNTTYDQLAEKMRSLGLTKVDLPWGDTVEHDGGKIIIHGHHEDATPKDTLFNELTNIQQSVIYNHVAETIDKIDRKLSADIMKLAARMVDRNTDDIQIDAAATLYNIPNNKDGQNIEVSVLKMDEKGEFFVMTSEGMQHPLADIYFADQITLIDKANHALNYDKKTEESIDKLLSGEMMPKDMESLLQKAKQDEMLMGKIEDRMEQRYPVLPFIKFSENEVEVKAKTIIDMMKTMDTNEIFSWGGSRLILENGTDLIWTKDNTDQKTNVVDLPSIFAKDTLELAFRDLAPLMEKQLTEILQKEENKTAYTDPIPLTVRLKDDDNNYFSSIILPEKLQLQENGEITINDVNDKTYPLDNVEDLSKALIMANIVTLSKTRYDEIEAYLDNSMKGEEREKFQKELKENPELREEKIILEAIINAMGNKKQQEEIKAESEERYKNMLKDVREHIENAFPDSWISLSDPLKHEKTLSITIDGKDTGISPIALPEDFKEKQTFGFVVQIPSDDNKESAFMAAETAMEYPDKMKVINEKSVLFYDINDALDFQKQLQNLPEVEKLDKLEQQAQNALPIANPQWQRDNNEQIEGAKLLLYGNDSGIRAEYLQPVPYEDTKKEKLELAFAVSDGINAANIDSLAEIYSKQHPDQQMFNNGDDDLTVKFLDVRHALQFQSFVNQLVNAEPQLSETQTQNMTDIKNRYPDSLILNRNGNSYEAYGNNAQKLSALLELPINYERGFAVTKIDARKLDSALPEMISKGQHTMVVDDKELSIRTQAKVINEIGSQLIETLGEGHHSLIGHPPTEQLPGFHLAAKNELGYINITSLELSNDKIPTVSLNSEDNKTTMSLLLLPLDQQQNLLAYAKALNAYQNFQQSIEDHLAQQNDNPEIQKAHQLIHELGLNFTPIGLRTPVTIPADLDDWGSEEEVLSHVMFANDKIMAYTKRNDAYDGNNGIDISNLSSGTQSEIIQKINEQLSDNDRFMTVYVDTQNVPGWAINGLINGDYTGLSHKEIQMIEDFYQNYPNHIFSPRDYDNAFDTNPAFGEPTDTIPVDIVRTATPAMLRQEELQTNQIVSINDIGSKLIDLLGEGRQSLISDTPVHNLQGFHLPANNDQGYINIEALDLTNKDNPSVLLNSEDNKVSIPLLSLPQDQQQNLLDYAERLVEHQLEDDKQYLMDIIMANKRAEKETIIDIPGNLYVFLGDDNSINFGHYDMPGEIEALEMVDIKQQREIVKHALNNADDEAALREWAQKEDVHITFDPLENFRNSFRETGIKALPVRFNNDDRRFMDNDGIVRTPFLDFSNDKSHRPETMIAPAAVEYQKQTDTLLLHGKNINGDNLTIPLDPILHRKDQKQAYDIVAQQLESTMLEAMTHIQRIGKLAEKSIQDQKATEAFIHNISNTGLYLSDGGSIEIGHYDNEKKLLSYKHKDKMGWFEDEGWVAPISIAHRIHNGDAVPVLAKNQVDTSLSYPHIDELMTQNAKQQSSDLARLNEKFLNTVFSYSDGVNTEKAIIIDVKQKTPDPANPSGIELSAVSETGAYFNIIPDSPNNRFTQTGNKLDGIAAELSKMGFSDQTDKPDRMLNDPINFCRIKGQRHNADNAPLDELLVDFGPNHFYLRQQIEDGGKGPYKASYEIENLDLSTKEKVVDINIDLAYDIMRQQISRYDLHKEQSHSLYKMENLLKDVAHNSPLQTVELISPLYNIPNNNIEDHENPDAKIIDVTMFDLDDKGNIILHGNGGPVQLNALNYTARYETTRRIANDITYQNLDLPIKQTKVLDYYHTNDNVDVIKPFQKPVTLLDKNGNYQIVEAAIVNNDNKIMLYSNFKDAVKAHDKLTTDNNDLHGIPLDNIITQDQRKVLNGAIKFYESPEKVRSTYINAQRIVDNQHLEGQPIDLDKMRPLFDQPKLFPNIIGEWQPVIPVSMDSKVIEQIDRLRNGEKDNQQVNENESKPQIMLFQYLEEAIDYANGGNSKPMRLEWFTEEAQKQILSSIIESQNNQNLSFSNNMSNQNSEENKMKTEQKPQAEQQTVDPEIKKHEKEAIREAATAAILATIGQSIPKLKLADDQHITLDTNKGSSIEVQTISVTKNNSLSLYGEMDGTKKSISANQLTDESINKLAAHVEAMAQSRTMTNEAAVAKPTEQKVAPEQKTETQQVQQPEQKNGQNAETKQAETPNQQTSNEQKQTQPQQAEQKADQTQERKVEPIEIKPDSKVEFNISRNPVLDKVYDIKLYVDGEKKGGHHLSLEDRKDFFDKKVTGPELLSKYFEKELAGQKLPDNIERHHFERKQDAAEQKTDTKQAQTQQTEQKADQTRERKVEPIEIKPDSKVEFNISRNPVLDKVYDIKLYVDGEKKGGHHLSLEDRKDFFDKKVTGPELLSKYFEKELAGQKLPDNIERHHFERKQDAAEQKTDTKQAQTQQTEQKADQTREQKSAVKPDEVIAAWKKAGEPDKTTFIQRENDKEKFYQTFGADAAKVAQILNRQAKPVSSESNADLAYISINQKDMPNLMKSLKEQGDQIKVVDMNGKYARVLPEQQAKKADDYSKYQMPENKLVENFKIWPHNGKVFMNAEVNGNKLPTKEVSWDDRQAHKEGKATPEQLVAKHYAPAEMNVKREQSQSKGMSR